MYFISFKLFHFFQIVSIYLISFPVDLEADERVRPLRHPDGGVEAPELPPQHRGQEVARPPGHDQADGRAKSSHQIFVET